MCGIAGIIKFNKEKVTKQEIKNMTDCIKHRGPDAEGIFVKGNIGLGHRRLAILDLKPEGNQPMFYQHKDKKVVIIHNGEIYNYLELKKKLVKKGYKFRTRTDTEVIMASYLEYGLDCVKQFNGMWAFAIYDFYKNIVFLSRDRFGIKPLYYYENKDKFVFCSEIKGILIDRKIDRIPNEDMISSYLYLNFYDYGKETFFKNIFRLEPGTNLMVDLNSNSFDFHKYYDLWEEYKRSKFKNLDLKELFFDSIRKRLISDVPVGSCLSGGIDSSAIVCTIRHLKPKAEIKTFSLHFPGKKINEEDYQKEVINYAQTEGYFTTFNSKEVLNSIAELIYIQEEPFNTFSILGQYKVMELAHKNNMKVLLDGQGCDEILLGYRHAIGLYLINLFKGWKFKLFFKELFNVKRVYGLSSLKGVFWIFPNCVKEFILRRKGNWINLEISQTMKDYLKLRKDIQSEQLSEETFGSLPKLLRFEDKNSMHFSIETRVPFCDHRFVESVLNIDPTKKIHNGYTKYPFRKAMVNFVPQNILWRKDKIGFVTPDDDLLREPKGQKLFRDIFFSKEFESRKYWNAKKLQKMLTKHIRGSKSYNNTLVKVFVLELWLRIWIDNSDNFKKGFVFY